MTLPKFTSRAMDLSGIAAAAKAPPVPPGASFVIDVDERNFETVMQLSMKHPVVVELYSPRANAQALSDDLIALANAASGAYLLARVNVDVSGQIAQAFGIRDDDTIYVTEAPYVQWHKTLAALTGAANSARSVSNVAD